MGLISFSVALFGLLLAVCTAQGVGKWAVKDAAGNVCLLVQFEATFFFQVPVDKSALKYRLDIPVNGTDTSKSSCQRSILSINFGYKNDLYFKFAKTDKSYVVEIIELSYLVNPKIFPGDPDIGRVKTATLNSTTLFETPDGSSFQCTAAQNLTKFSDPTAMLQIQNVQIEAFRTSKSENFELPVFKCPKSTAGPDGPDAPWYDVPVVIAGIFVSAAVCTVLLVYIIRVGVCKNDFLGVD